MLSIKSNSTGSSMRIVAGFGCAFMVAFAVVFGVFHAESAIGRSDDAEKSVEKALSSRLPRTKVERINCSVIDGLCEVTAGQTLFYTDRKARFLVIGRVYDMETRADVTAARMLELQPDMLLAGAAKVDGQVAGGGQQGPAKAESVSHVDMSALGARGAIHWGPTGGTKVTLFSDFRCSYCQRMVGELKSLGFRVEERPISVLGSRKLSEVVYCAADQKAAVEAAYAGAPDALPQRKGCNPSDLDENEAFARRNGFNGTPVLVRSDGAVLVGYRPAAQIAAWAKTPKSARG